jgi:hypothetical protein
MIRLQVRVDQNEAGDWVVTVDDRKGCEAVLLKNAAGDAIYRAVNAVRGEMGEARWKRLFGRNGWRL